MKKVILYFLTVLVAMVSLTACKKDKLDDSYPINGLGGDTWVKGDIDKWIADTLTTPFNLEILYKWDQFQDGDITKTLVPPDESKVIPLLRTIKKIWIDSYVKAASLSFMKTYIPKQIALIGSPSYNSNGTITLGEAEGGKKILLYTVNDFSLTKRDDIKRRLRTIQHEFAHILHQTVMFTPDYERITAADYTGDWTNQSLATALSKGFISPYAMSAREEDFAEMVAHMLMEGPDGFDALVNSSTTAAGITALRKKQAIIVSYFKTVWNIDFALLQKYVQDALDDVSPNPLTAVLGFGKVYKSVRFPLSFTQTSTPFADSVAKANTLLKAYNSNGGRYIDSVLLLFTNTDTLMYRLKYINPTSGANLVADFRFKFTTNAAGETTLGPVVVFTSARSTTDGNADLIKATMTPITNFIGGRTFTPKWPTGRAVSGAPVQVGGLYMKADETNYLLGYLFTGIN